MKFSLILPYEIHSAAFPPAASMWSSSTVQKVFVPRKCGIVVMVLGDLEPIHYKLDWDSTTEWDHVQAPLKSVFKTDMTSNIWDYKFHSFTEKQKASKHSF